MTWKPNVTVATVVMKDNRFLMVEETGEYGLVYNQPAGHLEPGESLVEAAVRETLEETAWHIEPRHVVGVYRWTSPANGLTYMRTCFAADCLRHEPERPLDEGIKRACWLSREEVAAAGERLRSPLVLACIDDYLAGNRFPLTLIHDFD